MFSQCFGMLPVRKNESSLRQWSGGAAQLRTLEETLVLLHANANYALFWQQCFFSHDIKYVTYVTRCIHLPRCLRPTVTCGKTLLPQLEVNL